MDFHLRDVYSLFRTLALTHLVVVDDKHAIVGIITRKDLLGHNILNSQYKKGTHVAVSSLRDTREIAFDPNQKHHKQY